MEKLNIDGIEVEIHRNYYETGELNQEWLQTTYDLHGYQKTFYKNGQLKEHQEYRNNNWIGIDTRFFENGKNLKETTRISDSLFFCEEWFENSKNKSEYYLTNKKQVIGNRTDWFENGNIKLKITYSDSTNKNGIHTAYYENSEICLKAKYENDIFYILEFSDTLGNQTLKSGNGYIETLENGKLKYLDSYQNGLRNGLCTIYNKEGLLRSEGVYINGKANGKTIWYKPNGAIDEIIYMENDIMTKKEKY